MASELQQLVDHLGNRLGRSVAIDDPHIRLLAYNAHTEGDVDDVRLRSIMRRSVSGDVVSYIRGKVDRDVTDLFTVPASAEIGLTVERIGIPIRFEDTHLGYLWLLDSDGPLDPDAATAVREAADRAALILHREHLTDELARGRERELVRDLVADDAALRTEAATALLDEELVVTGKVTALVATFPGSEPLGERDRMALAAAVDHGRRRLSPHTAMSLPRPRHALLIAVWPGAREGTIERSVLDLAVAVHERLVAESGREPATCPVGIGGTRAGLLELRASYREARRAAEVAGITGALGQVVPHAKLGVYALLAQLPPGELADALHPGIRPLLEADGDPLVETLQAFLDNAGDVKRTAAQLHVHRATLYYRLRKVEEQSGLDLSVGDDRLAAHLSLKLARLIGT